MDFSNIDLLVEQEGEGVLCISAPGTFEELLSILPGSDSSLLYNRKGTWVKIIDGKTYQTILKRALNSGTDEIALKLENSLPAFPVDAIPQEESKDESWTLFEPSFQVDSSSPLLSYRRLNGLVPEFKGVAIQDLDISLKELSNLIIQMEGLGEGWTCAFYSEDGYPLTGTLAQMPNVKCSDVLPANSKICLFTVPDFDLKSLEPLDPNEGPNSLTLADLNDATLQYTIKVDLTSCTVAQLKQKLHFLTKAPTFEIKFKTDEAYLAQDAKKLDEYGLIEGSVVKFYTEAHNYNDRTYKKKLRQSIEQTAEGQRVLHSCLHCFAYNIATCEIPTKECFLAGLRSASQNCTPLLQAMSELCEKKRMSLLNSIALEEGFILMIQNVLRDVLKVEGQVPSNKLLEHSAEILGLICEVFSKPNIESYRDEEFKEYDTRDSLTYGPIKTPVQLKRSDGTIAFYDIEILRAKLQAAEQIPLLPDLTEEQLKVSPEFQILVKRCALSAKETMLVWQGSFQFAPSFVQLTVQNAPNLTWNKAKTFSANFKLTKQVPQLSLKDTSFKNCMTVDKQKRLRVNLGLSDKMPNKVDLMDVLTRKTESFDVDDLATHLQLQAGEESKELITRPPAEAVVVVFDKSGSMGSDFCNDVEFTRIAATKQFFENFVDRTVGYQYQHVMSLLLFSNDIKQSCKFTENLNSFAYIIHRTSPGGGTKLWDSIDVAVDLLAELKQRYADCKLRILCLSDGEDNGSKKSYFQVCQRLLENSVTMDSVVVGAASQDLKSISFATGGFVFLPNSMQDGYKLFESETFLSVRNREVYVRPHLAGPSDLDVFRSRPFSGEQPSMKAPDQVKTKTMSVDQAVRQAANSSKQFSSKHEGGRHRRIMKELENINNNPHPDVSIYPSADDTCFWNIFIKGPEHTPYYGGLYQLYARFPDAYPFKPPEVRFLTPIYHCNINSTGKICHSILSDQYSPAISIRHVIDCIFGLLMTPEPTDPLDANIAAIYLDDYPTYERNAIEHTRTNASKSIVELMPGYFGAPPHFLDPISGKLMSDPVIVMKSNKTYERSEIEKVIQQTGKDPETAEDISLTDLVPNSNLKHEIEQFVKNSTN